MAAPSGRLSLSKIRFTLDDGLVISLSHPSGFWILGAQLTSVVATIVFLARYPCSIPSPASTNSYLI